MKAYNCDLGSFGEGLTQNYLRNAGYYILEENFHCRIGEIDIIARDGDFICFIEVKSRCSNKYGSPMESITLHKQRKIRSVAKYYIMINNLNHSKFRFDAVEVYIKEGSYHINLIKNAF